MKQAIQCHCNKDYIPEVCTTILLHTQNQLMYTAHSYIVTLTENLMSAKSILTLTVTAQLEVS